MPAIPLRRINVGWTTGIGGSGVSVFYCAQPDDLTSNLATFFNAIKAFFPTPVTWNIPASGDLINPEDGHLAGAWVGGTAASIPASGGAGAYVAGTGAYVRWVTGAISGTHKVQGRTYLVPLLTSQFDTQGTITDTSVTTMQAAATALAASAKLIVWHRPHKGGVDGASFLVGGAVVPDKVTSLRTRRT